MLGQGGYKESLTHQNGGQCIKELANINVQKKFSAKVLYYFSHSCHYSSNTCLCCTFQSSLRAVWYRRPISIWDPRGPHSPIQIHPTLRPPPPQHHEAPLFSVERTQQGEDLRSGTLWGCPGPLPIPILESIHHLCSSSPDPRCVPIHCLTVIRDHRGAHCTGGQGELQKGPLLQGLRSHNVLQEVPQCPIVTGGGPWPTYKGSCLSYAHIEKLF